MHKFALISGVDFSQPKCSGRLKSTLLASKYTEEFKNELITLGLPRYVFKLPLYDKNVEENLLIMKFVKENHPDENDYNKLIKYFNEETELRKF